MKKLLLTLAMIFFCFTCQAESAQIYPKNIVVFDGLWLGSTSGGKWKSSADFSAEMAEKKGWVRAQWALEYPFPYPWGGETYSIYDIGGYLHDAQGEGLHSDHPGEFEDDLLKVKMHTKTSPYLGVSELEGNAQKVLPRMATALSTKNATYEKILKDWLAKNGLSSAKANISQLFKVDLEGDGVDEIVIVAQNILDASGEATFLQPDISAGDLTAFLPTRAERGMYSVVLLRKVVGGKAREIPLAAFLTKEGSSSDSRLPAISRIYQFADLNGDGTLEIVTGEVNCKDYRYKVTDVRKDGAFEVVLGSGASPPSGAAGSLPRTAETRTIMVSNSREFLEALGSNRVIEMKPGTYNLSEMDEYLNYAFKRENQAPRYPNLEKDGAVKLAKGIIWSNEPFDGSELVIKGIQNLTIRGLTTGEGAAEIVVDPRYAFVLKFVQCTDITIENLTAGHTTSGNCEGGVFSFTDSSRITINGTNMYGSGTEGLLLKNVSDMTVTGSQIFECTYYIMTITDSRNITFDDCVFRENKQYSMVNVLGENDTITFTCCRFTANYGEMFVVDDLSRVTVANSSFFGNSDSRIPESRNVAFTDCEFD